MRTAARVRGIGQFAVLALPAVTPILGYMNRHGHRSVFILVVCAALGLALAATTIGPTAAQDTIPGMGNSTTAAPIDLPTVRSVEQRRDFVVNQQRLLEQDRNIKIEPVRPIVPKVKPNCQIQLGGSRALARCD